MIFKGVEICCPHCRGDLEKEEEQDASLRCLSCGRRFPVVFGIPDLRAFPDPYIAPEPDRAKGKKVAARFDELSFRELLDYYYSITEVVPPRHAQQYTRGVLAGVPRSKAALAFWQHAEGAAGQGATVPMRLLDIGCGTAPLLVAAAGQYEGFVGIDIAFRWLVVAKKRLAEAGLDVPLLCACAEALPFPEGAFDRVVLDSVIEHVRDQPAALAESYRVMRPGGFLFAATPNRYSLGPDPQTGLWAGSLLPERWSAAYVRYLGGIPPKRKLLSARALTRLLRKTNFRAPRVMLPDIPEGQRAQLGGFAQRLVDLYHAVKKVPGARTVLQWIGPLLYAVAQKPVLEADRRKEPADRAALPSGVETWRP